MGMYTLKIGSLPYSIDYVIYSLSGQRKSPFMGVCGPFFITLYISPIGNILTKCCKPLDLNIRKENSLQNPPFVKSIRTFLFHSEVDRNIISFIHFNGYFTTSKFLINCFYVFVGVQILFPNFKKTDQIKFSHSLHNLTIIRHAEPFAKSFSGQV